MNTGIFKEEEKIISDKFLLTFEKEVELFNKLLETYASFLDATSGKVKDNEYPDWTILILLSQTLPLMDNGLNLLSKGYLRSSEITIRVASEAIILSTYFKEFPEAEEEYRTMHYTDFFHKHDIDKMLKKVERDGKFFITDKKKAKELRWNKRVFLNLFKESSRFLHNNPEVIYKLSSNTSDTSLIMGPQLYSNDVLSMGLRRLFNTLITSLVILGKSLNIVPNNNEIEIIKESSRLINELNKSNKN